MHRRVLARAALAILLAGACAPPLLHRAADAAVERRIRAALGGAPGVAVGRVRSRADLGRIELGDLSVRGPGWGLTVGALSVDGAAPALPSLVAPAAAGFAMTVRAKDLAVSLGDAVTIRIPELIALGTDLSADDLAAFAHPANLAALKDMATRLGAASLSAPAVEIAFKLNGDSANPVLVVKNLALTDVTVGRIGSLAADGCTMAAVVIPTDPPALTTGALSVSSIDLPRILDVLGGSRTDADAQVAPLFRSLTLGALAIADRDRLHWTVGRFSLGALNARPLLVPPADLAKLLNAGGAEPSAVDKQVVIDAAADAARSFVLDHAEVDEVSVSSPADGLKSFKLGRAAVDGVEPLNLHSLAIDAVAVEAESTEVTLGHLAMSDYDATGFIDVFKRQLLGLPATVGGDKVVLPPRSSLTLTDLSIRPPSPPKPGQGGGMQPLQPSDRPVQVPVFSAEGGADAASGQVSSDAQLQVVYDFGDDPNMAEVARYGIKRLDMAASFGVDFDTKAKTLQLSNTFIDVADLGSLSVGMRFVNVDPAVLQAGADQAAILEAGQNAVFDRVAVGFVNHGVIEKVVPPLAAAAKVSVPLFKAQLKAQVDLGVTQALGPSPVTQRVISAVRTFIDTPRNISVNVAAPGGLPVAKAAATDDPKTLISDLDVDVQVNQ